MKLADYLVAERLNFSAAAASMTAMFPAQPVRPDALRSWALRGDHLDFDMPRPYRMRQIFAWSRGRVTPDDFYDLPALDAEGRVIGALDSAGRAVAPAGSADAAPAGDGATDSPGPLPSGAAAAAAAELAARLRPAAGLSHVNGGRRHARERG